MLKLQPETLIYRKVTTSKEELDFPEELAHHIAW